MISRTDGDRTLYFMERAAYVHEQFRSGQISADQYRAHLYSLGFRGQEIESEVSLNYPTAGVRHGVNRPGNGQGPAVHDRGGGVAESLRRYVARRAEAVPR
jgi:hypothetical protein